MKKQIAVLMAAATAVTTVAPAIATAAVNEHSEVSVATVNAKIKEALDKKFKSEVNEGIGKDDFKKTDDVKDYQKSQYLVVLSTKGTVTDNEANGLLTDADKKAYDDFINDSEAKKVTGGKEYVVTDAAKVSGLIEKLVLSGDETVVSIIDKGATKDGEAVEIITDKLVKSGSDVDEKTQQSSKKIVEILAKFIKTDKKAGFVDELKVDEKAYDASKDYTDAKKIEVKLTSGKEIKIKEGDKAIDLETVMTDKTELKIYDAESKNPVEGVDQSAYDKITGFKNLATDDDKKVQRDVATGDVEVYTLDDVDTKEVKIEDIFTKDGGYTEAGADFINKIKTARDNTGIFNHAGTSYKVDKTNLENALKAAKIVERNGQFALEFVVAAKDANDELRDVKLKISISGKNAVDLQTVKDDLNTKEEVVVGKFVKLIGADRYATAIKVSEETFEDKAADSVVIVGGASVIDGLSAAPLASAKNAPILLAGKKGLSADTLNEIERVCDKLYNKTVYIVGGQDSVTKDVEKQLKDKFPSVVINRIAGSDRYDTSLKIAKRLKDDDSISNKAFAVGGKGAPDAMSIAPVAADKDDHKVDPIIVVPKDAVSKDVRDYLGNSSINNIVALGGESTISTQALKDLRAIAGGASIERVYGESRYATNLAILKKYYSASGIKKNGIINKNGLIVASGAEDKLVDAQTASIFAAGKETRPIMLAGNKATDDQADYLKNNKKDLAKKVYQVGGVVSADVMKTVVEKLGL
nr:cell wall-binding repeat-containing protein [uncultured Peptostreptococcus sp.]